MSYTKQLLKAIFLLLPFTALAQVSEQDCVNAITICQNTYSYTTPVTGSRNVPTEINNQNSCLGAGELNAIWFKVYISQTGDLKFTVLPNTTTNDYDWAVYNLTSVSCADIFNNPSLEVSCNFSGSISPTAATGPNGGTNPNVPGYYPQENPAIPVQTGELYYIVVSSFSGNTDGFVIDFTGSTGIGFTSQVQFSANQQPTICSPNQLNVYLNQPVQCFSLAPTDFTLFDANNQQIPISSINAPECDNILDYTQSLMLYLDQSLQVGSTYKLVKNGSLTTACGYADTQSSETVFNIFQQPLTVSGFNIQPDTCYNDAQVGPSIFNQSSPLSNSWLLPGGVTSIEETITAITDGDYTVTVTGTTGCSSTYTGYIDVFTQPLTTVYLHYSNDTMYALPNIFQEYDWSIYGQNFQPIYNVVTYPPENYLLLSNYPFARPGTIKVNAYNQYGCLRYESTSLLGTEELTKQPAFKINTITADRVVLTATTVLNGSIGLYNISGMQLQNQRAESIQSVQFDISQYPQGIYIVTYTATQGQTYSTKIVKVGN